MRRAALAALAATVLAAATGCRGDDAPAGTAVESATAREPLAAATASPSASEPASYVGAERCAPCHAEATAAWRGSQHDRAMELPDASSVLGDFDDASFTRADGSVVGFRREGERFVVRDRGPDGELADFEVAATFGVAPLQQVLLRLPGGRLQAHDVAWDVDAGRWFELYPDEPLAPGDPLHWTGALQRWNHMCAECHSTDLEKGYDAATDRYATRYAEIDVGCEACHGPGSHHVEWAEAPVDRRSADADPGYGLTTALVSGPTDAELASCAPCHSRRHAVSASDRHGEPFLDHFRPALLTEGLYHADGQILEEVYVWGSFVQSRMHAAGVRCSDCHDPHSATPLAAGNALCTRCHGVAPPERFAGLRAGAYDTPEHHHHAPGGAGAACVDCHMPERTYMVVDPRRDHSLRVPRPDLSERTGAPDACTGCHVDRDPAWAAARIDEWFPRPEGSPRPAHYGETLALARAGAAGAPAALRALLADGEAPAIARATAAQALGERPDAESLDALLAALASPEPLVRAEAAEALPAALIARGEQARVTPTVRALGERLDDERRAVRQAAALALLELPRGPLGDDGGARLERVLDDYAAAQRADADQPGAHLNLGVLADRRGEPAVAEREYRAALALDPGFAPARFNLVHLLNGQGRNTQALAELRAILERDPDDGEAHYSLGLLLAELGRMEQAATALEHATKALPERARARYNLALVLEQLGRAEAAREALLEAAELDPRDADVANALALSYARAGRFADALPHARRLVELVPGDAGARRLLDQLETESSR